MHIPVLLEETVAALAPRPGCVYVDGTLGQAGHAAAVMRLAGPGGTLLGIDRDGEALARAEANLRRGDVPGGTCWPTADTATWRPSPMPTASRRPTRSCWIWA